MKTISSSGSVQTIWLVLIALIGVGALLFFLSHAVAQKKEVETQPTTPMKETSSAAQTSGSKEISDTALRKRLTPEQYYVTKQNGTEAAFRNEYWDNHRAGIYVDVISGEPLFSSLDKFDSGTGWPSFTKALPGNHIVEKTDRTLGMARTEIRSRKSDAHLGHLFNDGPKPTGMRYCMNSAALRFIPIEKLKEEGYGEYLPLFEKK